MSSGYGPNSKFDATSDEYRNEHDRLFGKAATEVEEVIPQAPEIWRHKRTGQVYVVIEILNKDADESRRGEYPITVAYMFDGRYWGRPLESFLRSFEKVM